MKFVKVNYHLNQTYHVENVAFEELVKNAIKQVKGIKVLSSEVEVDEKNNDFLVKVTVEKSKSTTFAGAASKIQTAIEEYSVNLIQSKPRNIQIIFNEAQ